MAKHAHLMSLPPEVLERVESDLRKGLATRVVAQDLHAAGLLKELSAPSLGKALRVYRTDRITVPEVARRTSIERSPNPQAQALILKKADQWDAHASWMRLIKNAEQRYWKLSEQFKGSPIQPDSVRRAATEMHKMYESYTKFLLETGAIRRAPQQHQHIVASQVQIHSATDAGQLVQALTTWLSGNEEPLPHFQVASLENLVTQLKINDALHALRDARAELPRSPEEEQATKRRSAHLLRLINGEGDEEPVVPRVPAMDDPRDHPLVILDHVGRESAE